MPSSQQIDKSSNKAGPLASTQFTAGAHGTKIMFCVNGDNRIGMGHVKRCLALSRRLKESLHCDITYFMESFSVAEKDVSACGYRTTNKMPDEIMDIIITSLPYISDNCISDLKKRTKRLVCLDDSRKTRFSSDIVVRGSIVPELCGADLSCSATFLLGRNYMILDQSFQKMHDMKKNINPIVKSIVITMGGSDINDFTVEVIEALNGLDLPNIKKTVVIGPAFENIERFRTYKNFDFLYNISNMAEVMFHADIVIAGAGMTLYELACVGTPGIALCQTNYQSLEARCFEREKAVLNLGQKENISAESIQSELKFLLNDYRKRQEMSISGKKLIDGKAVDRIMRQIFKGIEI